MHEDLDWGDGKVNPGKTEVGGCITGEGEKGRKQQIHQGNTRGTRPDKWPREGQKSRDCNTNGNKNLPSVFPERKKETGGGEENCGEVYNCGGSLPRNGRGETDPEKKDGNNSFYSI